MASDVGEPTNWQPHSNPQTDDGSNENADLTNQQSEEPTSSKPQNPSDSGEGSGFECNICLDLAKDPVVTLCGHLFCWPCLYRWLRHHSQSQDCPVCKALVQEEKLVPLYGRGKTQSDPRSRPVDIPNRPAAQRLERAEPFLQHNHPNAAGFGLFDGIIPMATASFGGISISAGFSNLFPSVHVHVQGTPPNAAAYGAAPGYAYGGHDGGGAREVPEAAASGTENDNSSALSKMFLLFGAVVVLFLSWGYE